MTDETEWGPWIDHDGKGRPVPKGIVVEADFYLFGIEVVTVRADLGSWFYGSIHDRSTWSPGLTAGRLSSPITRYRVKKPKAMKMIMELLENLPVTKLPEKEKV